MCSAGPVRPGSVPEESVMPLGDPSIPEPSADAGQLGRVDADEELWDPLLLSIEEGRVIPIIGRDLLTVAPDGVETLLYAVARRAVGAAPSGWMWTRSAERRRWRPWPRGTWPPAGTRGRSTSSWRCCCVTSARCRCRRRSNSSRASRRSSCSSRARSIRCSPAPSTRCGSTASTTRRSSPTLHGRRSTFRPTGSSPIASFVFHLLGKVSSMEGSYVVSEEDALEFVHSLQGPGPAAELSPARSTRAACS